jgi:hypothetical protein
MKIKKTTFKVVGLSPLLTNNPASMSTQDGGPKKKKIPSPEEEAKAGLYVNANGCYYIPSIAFRSALLAAMVGKKIGKRAARTIMAASVFNADEQTILIDPDTEKPLTEYVIDSRRAVVQGQGITRHRPRFDKWAAKVTFEIDEEMMPVKAVEEWLNEAGTMAGGGDYRVNKRGPFGRF